MAWRGSGSYTAARVIQAITGVIVGIIVLGIILVLLNANKANPLVNFTLDIGSWLTYPFHQLFKRPTEGQDVLINWGLAALVYLVVGGAIARFAR